VVLVGVRETPPPQDALVELKLAEPLSISMSVVVPVTPQLSVTLPPFAVWEEVVKLVMTGSAPQSGSASRKRRYRIRGLP
jgi:hypothetical protein